MKKTVLFLIILSYTAVALKAQPISNNIETILKKYSEQGLFNGCALVAEGNNILHKNAYGYSNQDTKTPNSIDTKFMIGSCTKQFTAALIMLLQEENKLKLSDKISKYITDYPSESANKITIHHLLSHTSGIPEYFALREAQKFMFIENKPEDFVKVFWNLNLEFEPGAQYKYSNSGYFLLGLIIEKITNNTYAEALQDKIFKPLKMKNSGMFKNSVKLTNMANGYILKDNLLKLATQGNASAAYAAGGIYSTVDDFMKWQNALRENSLLSSESMKLMVNPHTKQYGYGLGVISLLAKNGKLTIYGHEGEFWGFRSLFHIIDKGKYCIILLDNHEDKSLMKIATEIRNFLYN